MSRAGDVAVGAEFSIPVAVSELPPGGTTLERRADDGERAALAERLGVTSLEELAIEVALSHTKRGVRADGHLQATVVQPCSVTLEPLVSQLDLPIELEFEHENFHKNIDFQDVDVDEDDPPEDIVGGRFDLGETLVQVLAVEIDPFPRSPDLPYADTESGTVDGDDVDGASERNPFAALAALKDKLEDR